MFVVPPRNHSIVMGPLRMSMLQCMCFLFHCSTSTVVVVVGGVAPSHCFRSNEFECQHRDSLSNAAELITPIEQANGEIAASLQNPKLRLSRWRLEVARVSKHGSSAQEGSACDSQTGCISCMQHLAVSECRGGTNTKDSHEKCLVPTTCHRSVPCVST
jgi:hypothetical protein